MDPMRHIHHLPAIHSVRLYCAVVWLAMLPGRMMAALIGGKVTFTLKFEIDGQDYSLRGDYRTVLADLRRIGEHRGIGA